MVPLNLQFYAYKAYFGFMKLKAVYSFAFLTFEIVLTYFFMVPMILLMLNKNSCSTSKRTAKAVQQVTL